MKLLNLFFVTILSCCFCFSSKSQEYSYKRYTVREGLAGNHVYDALEDHTGFLWFATETGVSRFDGTSFKNFTTAEGLPDNEILKLFIDSKGRVWMLPYKNAICYCYNGKIFNASNDSIIHAIRVKDYVQSMAEDGEGNIFFIESRNIIVLTKDGKVLSNQVLLSPVTKVTAIGIDNRAQPVLRTDSFFCDIKISHNAIELRKKDYGLDFWNFKLAYFLLNKSYIIYPNNYMNMFESHSMVLYNYIKATSDTIDLPSPSNSITSPDGNSFFFNTQKGAFAYDITKGSFSAIYLDNENVSSSLTDNESNIWFTTLGRGIFRLSSGYNRNIFFPDNQNRRKPVESIFVTATDIIVGSDKNILYKYNKKTGQTTSVNLETILSRGDIIKIKQYRNSLYILSDACLKKSDTSLKKIKTFSQTEQSWSYKDFDIGKNGRLYFSTHFKAFSFDAGNAAAAVEMPEYHDLSKLNAIMRYRNVQTEKSTYYEGRTTSVCYTDSGIYLGAINGLKFVDWNKKVTELGDVFPVFKKRITKLCAHDNLLWIGTNDAGVFCFNGKKIIKNIASKDGLTGNLVRALYADRNHLWIGTDRGLNKIGFSDTAYPILQTYTTSDGLTGDVINAVYTQGDTVYVGTPEGLSFFDEQLAKVNSKCDLQILGITISGKLHLFDSSRLVLKNKNNNIRFDFVALSFKSEGNIQYYYKLSGIDEDWKTTRQNFLQYPTLPSGNYLMQLYAVNKFGIKSGMVMIHFEIEKTLIEKGWFIALMILAVVFIAWFIANSQVRRLKRLQKEKTSNAEKIAQLEQQALKAQMNPHFIFNCLNSIQQYVIDKDVQGANRFISGFSRLIRQTLDNSGKQNITVAEEESFLRSYLDLEKSRFEEKFDYSINIDRHINKDEDTLPPMLLQPYIENCIRHGIMHKSNGKGSITIEFNLVNGNLVCSITDDGIGRAAAGTYKGLQHISYQSKGTELTGQRIMMINKTNSADIILKTEDLHDEHGEPCGTKVTILVPLEKYDD